MLSVLFVNRSYFPDAEATGQLLTELCEQLATSSEPGVADQIDVSVICGQPNFNLENHAFKKHGKAERNGVTLYRVAHTQHDKSGFVGRVTNFITFLISATWQALRCPRPDVLVVETDPPLLCLLGWFVAKVRRVPFVCYMQDVYPDIAVELGRLPENLFTRALRQSFLYVYRRANRVVVVGKEMRKWLINHYVKPSQISVIENWVDTDKIRPEKESNKFRHHYGLEDKFVAMYSGNLGQTQRFDLLLDAAEQLRDERHIKFVLVGNGVKRRRLFDEVLERQLPNVRFVNYQPQDDLSQSLSAADVHFVLLDGKLTQFMMPSKIYSAMASGTPIIAVGRTKTRLEQDLVDSHLASMICQADAGFFVDEDNAAEQLADRIMYLAGNPDEAKEMGQNARRAAERLYGRSVPVAKFRRLLFSLAGIDQPKPKQRPAPVVPAPKMATPSVAEPVSARRK